jgi:phosphatidate cytidylyltransferase
MLKTRVLTALCMVAVFVAVVFWGGAYPTVGMLFVLTAIASWEWTQFFGLRARWLRGAYVALVVVLCALGGVFAQSTPVLLTIMDLAAVGWLGALWLLSRPTAKVTPRLAACVGPVVLVPCWLGLSALVLSPDRAAGRALLLMLLGLVAAADIGAYFAGRAFGRHKLAPSISPGKTWEGVAGGTLLGMSLCAALAWWMGVSVMLALLSGLAVVWMSVVGDLTESLFKRSVALKDSGWLFPGHGGVLDRIDGLTSTLPVAALALYISMG